MEPKFAFVDPAELRPNPWNTNVVGPENEEKLGESLKRHGAFKPLIVRETPDGLQILGGEHRWIAGKHLGLKRMPIANLGPIDDEAAKEIMLADNARYGADDTIALAELFEGMKDAEGLQEFLPFTESDFESIYSSVNIALDDLEVDENIDLPEEKQETAQTKAAKTHAMMRFKVPISDSERITDLIARTQKKHGFTQEDELTNAGDALVFLLLGGSSETEDEDQPE